MATTEALLTAEEFRLLPDPGHPVELVRGQIVMMNMPGFQHGVVCGNIAGMLRDMVRQRDLGYVTCNDAGVVTMRDPDSVRGADVAFYSYARIPKGTLPEGYPTVAPELVFEVRSPSDTMAELLAKTAEYLRAGVLVVCVVDPRSETLTVHHAQRSPQVLTESETLTLPELLPGLNLSVRELLGK